MNKKQKIENMDDFFNLRAKNYDMNRDKILPSYPFLYTEFSRNIPKTTKSIEILDLGAGTGIELEWIFKRMPNAIITCIDVSENMLKILQNNYIKFSSQIKIIKASYLDYKFFNKKYDMVISFMSFHHILPVKKIELYKNIIKSMKPNGVFIEGDYIVQTKKEEDEKLAKYQELQKENNINNSYDYHIDIPLSKQTQEETYKKSGFINIYIKYNTKAALMYVCTL